MANLLVTGGAGFIGSNYVFYHLKNFPEDNVVVLDALTYAGCRETLDPLNDNPHFTFVKGDILDEGLVVSLIEKYKIDVIVHFAAESHVDRSISGPDAFIKTNIEGTYCLLKAAYKMWVKDGVCHGHFHHISTDEVFGTLSLTDPPFSEENPYRPNSPYSASKASSDCLVRAFVHTYGLKATITNCSNNYGPRQFPEKLIPLVITNLLTGMEVPVYGDGKQIRDWLFVDDHCRAIDAAILSGQSDKTWNIGGRAELTNLEVVNTVCECIDEEFKEDSSLKDRYPSAYPAKGMSCKKAIVHVTDRPGHDRRYAIDPRKAEAELNFKPSLTFKEGIKLTLLWYLNNDKWWRELKKRTKDFSVR